MRTVTRGFGRLFDPDRVNFDALESAAFGTVANRAFRGEGPGGLPGATRPSGYPTGVFDALTRTPSVNQNSTIFVEGRRVPLVLADSNERILQGIQNQEGVFAPGGALERTKVRQRQGQPAYGLEVLEYAANQGIPGVEVNPQAVQNAVGVYTRTPGATTLRQVRDARLDAIPREVYDESLPAVQDQYGNVFVSPEEFASGVDRVTLTGTRTNNSVNDLPYRQLSRAEAADRSGTEIVIRRQSVDTASPGGGDLLFRPAVTLYAEPGQIPTLTGNGNISRFVPRQSLPQPDIDHLDRLAAISSEASSGQISSEAAELARFHEVRDFERRYGSVAAGYRDPYTDVPERLLPGRLQVAGTRQQPIDLLGAVDPVQGYASGQPLRAALSAPQQNRLISVDASQLPSRELDSRAVIENYDPVAVTQDPVLTRREVPAGSQAIQVQRPVDFAAGPGVVQQSQPFTQQELGANQGVVGRLRRGTYTEEGALREVRPFAVDRGEIGPDIEERYSYRLGDRIVEGVDRINPGLDRVLSETLVAVEDLDPVSGQFRTHYYPLTPRAADYSFDPVGDSVRNLASRGSVIQVGPRVYRDEEVDALEGIRLVREKARFSNDPEVSARLNASADRAQEAYNFALGITSNDLIQLGGAQVGRDADIVPALVFNPNAPSQRAIVAQNRRQVEIPGVQYQSTPIARLQPAPARALPVLVEDPRSYGGVRSIADRAPTNRDLFNPTALRDHRLQLPGEYRPEPQPVVDIRASPVDAVANAQVAAAIGGGPRLAAVPVHRVQVQSSGPVEIPVRPAAPAARATAPGVVEPPASGRRAAFPVAPVAIGAAGTLGGLAVIGGAGQAPEEEYYYAA